MKTKLHSLFVLPALVAVTFSLLVVPRKALATLVNVSPFTPVAPTITFSEFPLGTVNPSINLTASGIGNVTVSFTGTTDTDTSSSSSPVLGGNTGFFGNVSMSFSTPVSAVGFTAGVFDNIGSTTIQAFDANGNSLGTVNNNATGFIQFSLADSSGLNVIKSVNIYISGNEPEGFEIDNVSFKIPNTGSLLVYLYPSGAVSAGAQWQVDSGAFQNNGSSVGNLSVGNHTVSYKTIPGWLAPPNQLVNVAPGSTTITNASYAAALGAVHVTINPAGAVSAGAQWQVDGGAFQNSGVVVNSLALGSHIVSFNSVPGWISPSNQNVVVASGATNFATATYLLDVGALQVTLNPAGALSAGAQWQVDGGAFQNSGAILNNLATGSHTLSFNTVPNWISPSNQTVMIVLGATNNASATYLPSGAVQVNLAPAGAVSAGAQWQLDGGAFQSSGAIQANVPVGDHTLSFNTVSGWITPSNQTVTIALGATNTVAATYLPAVGALQVNLGPAGAVTAGAQWRLDGGAFQSSGAILTNVPIGSHTVSFNTVGGWLTPGNIAANVAFNTTNTYSASYTIAPGAVQVTILPASAVTAGAAWRLDGGTLQSSGATVTNISTGSHTISFFNITGWSTATNQTVSVSPGSTTTATGYYTPLDGLQVTITPSCAVGDGAQWQVDGGAFQNSGDTVTNLVPGKHIVSFNAISGWTAPINQTVTVAVGSTTNAVGHYREASIPGTIIWINAGANQKWSNPANWDLNRVPTNTDIVLIPQVTGTNCVLDVSATVAGLHLGDCAAGVSDGLNFNGQTLIVTGPIIVQPGSILVLDNYSTLIGTNLSLSGILRWDHGTLGGTFTVGNDGILQLTAAAISHDMPNCVLTNNGTVTWIGGQFHGGGTSPGTVIYNNGLWDAHDVLGFYTLGGNGIVFNNAGTFRKSQGTTATIFYSGTFLNNSGNLDIQTGVVAMQGGGNFTGGTATNSTGIIQLNGGAYNINGLISTTNFQMLSGSLIGANVLRGGFTWSGGDCYSAPSVTVNSNALLRLTGAIPMSNCLFTNNGVVNWVGGQIQGGGTTPGTVMVNNGLWDAQSDLGAFSLGGNGILFNNAGTFRKSTGPGQTSFYGGVTFNNTGTLNVQSGSVNLQGAYSLNGGTLAFGFNSLTNYGRLTLSSSVALGGSLKVNVGGTFAPAIGSQFQILSAASRSGAFSSVDLPAGLAVVYNPNSVLLNVSSAVPVQIFQPQLVGTNLSFQFPTASGQSYTVQGNNDLTTTNWAAYTNIIGAGSVYQFQVPVTVTPPRRYFRISEP